MFYIFRRNTDCGNQTFIISPCFRDVHVYSTPEPVKLVQFGGMYSTQVAPKKSQVILNISQVTPKKSQVILTESPSNTEEISGNIEGISSNIEGKKIKI